jgi:hypothetical protein
MVMPIVARGMILKKLAISLSAALALSASGGPLQARNMSATALPLGGWDAPHHVADDLALPLAASSTIHNVGSCLDDGSVGTLRQVVGISISGDTVDLGSLPLACSTITLSMGEINIPQSVLTFVGPADHTLTITANHKNRILHQTGASGLIEINQLTLSDGGYYAYSSDVKGGCIFSTGLVALHSSKVTGCVAYSVYGNAYGGAIYAKGRVDLYSSEVTDSIANTNAAAGARGGGIYGLNGLRAFYSTLSGNSAPWGPSLGGAACISGDIGIFYSTIDSNKAAIGGGISAGERSNTTSIEVQSSTVSGNTATMRSGGIDIFPFTSAKPVIIRSSTIAFNSAPHSAGVNSAHNVLARSSIIANNTNTSPDVFADLYVQGSGATLTGDSNLIVTSNLGLPGTLTSDPQLTPLGNHGGITRTHALLPGSPAVNHGSNVVNLSRDQRGFTREIPAGSPDIGAYERQVNDDEIFYGGFD